MSNPAKLSKNQRQHKKQQKRNQKQQVRKRQQKKESIIKKIKTTTQKELTQFLNLYCNEDNLALLISNSEMNFQDVFSLTTCS